VVLGDLLNEENNTYEEVYGACNAQDANYEKCVIGFGNRFSKRSWCNGLVLQWYLLRVLLRGG